jgi:hypothetical protein
MCLHPGIVENSAIFGLNKKIFLAPLLLDFVPNLTLGGMGKLTFPFPASPVENSTQHTKINTQMSAEISSNLLCKSEITTEI